MCGEDRLAATAQVWLCGLVNMQKEKDDNKISQGKDVMDIDWLQKKAALLEKNLNYNGAIDTYLKVTREMSTNKQQVAQCWNRAVQLAVDHMPVRLTEVSRDECVGRTKRLASHSVTVCC